MVTERVSPGLNVTKLFSSPLTLWKNKLECLYLASLITSSLLKDKLQPIALNTRGLYYKYIAKVNDDSRVAKLMLQVMVSLKIVILMTLEVSFKLLDNIYSTGITHDDNHMMTIIYL
jgi:hypothetical protein